MKTHPWAAYAAWTLLLSASAAPRSFQVRISADRTRVGMGRVVQITAQVHRQDGGAAAHCGLLPYVDGRRWGAHKQADSAGRAVFLLPLPRPGLHEIRVQAYAVPKHTDGAAWVWTPAIRDHQSVVLEKDFSLPAGKIRRARLWFAVDHPFSQ